MNLNYDYFYFYINNNISIDKDIHLNLIKKNSNIIFYNEDIILHKKYIYCFYEFITNYKNINNINNIIYYYNNNTEFINYKFNSLIIHNINQYNNEIYFDYNFNNDELLYIIKFIYYFENNNYKVILKNNHSTQYYFLKNYFHSEYNNINFTILNNLNEINSNNFNKKYILNQKINIDNLNFTNKYDSKSFHLLNNIHYSFISNIFKKLLFLNLKKNIIFINLDENITENFIIQNLIELDFKNSIIITYNLKLFNNKFKIFDNLSTIDFFEIFDNIEYNYNDIIIIFGLFIDYYIGYTNFYSKLWNFMNRTLLLYINEFDYNYINTQNLIIQNFDNIKNILYLNNKVINYNYQLFLIFNNNLFSIKDTFSYATNYYFNDYIYNYYFDNTKKFYDIDDLVKINKLNNNDFIYLTKYHNNYYYKYFNNYSLIKENYIIQNYQHYFINEYSFLNKINLIDEYVFIYKFDNFELNINYIKYICQFYKKNYSFNFNLEFYFNSYQYNENHEINIFLNNESIHNVCFYKYINNKTILNNLFIKFSHNSCILF